MVGFHIVKCIDNVRRVSRTINNESQLIPARFSPHYMRGLIHHLPVGAFQRIVGIELPRYWIFI